MKVEGHSAFELIAETMWRLSFVGRPVRLSACFAVAVATCGSIEYAIALAPTIEVSAVKVRDSWKEVHSTRLLFSLGSVAPRLS